MEENTYNGWTNYSTWRINLEYGFNDGDFAGYTADMLRDTVEEHLEMDCDNPTTLSYAMAFIDDVNWHEIARDLNEEEEV